MQVGRNRHPFLASPGVHPQASLTTSSNSRMLKIMTSSPTVTITKRPNPNHPRIMAVVPTPLRTLPFPKSWATCDAATDAVCCHSTLTSTNIDAMKMSASADCETALDGNGLSSTMSDEPDRSTSSCQPGKVARRMKVTNANIMATILLYMLVILEVSILTDERLT